MTAAAPELRIVSDDLWRAAHARLKRTSRRPTGAKGGNPELASRYLLSGFLKCGVCQGGMLVDLRSVRGRLQRAYVCARRKSRGRDACSNHHPLLVTLIDAAIIGELRTFLTAERLEETLASAAAGDPARLEADRQAIKADIAKVDVELGNLTNALASGAGFESLRTAIRARELARADLVRELARLEATAKTIAERAAVLDDLRDRLPNWRALLEATPEAARPLLRRLIAGPIVVIPHFGDGAKAFEYVGVGTFEGLIRGTVGLSTWALEERLGLADLALSADCPEHTVPLLDRCIGDGLVRSDGRVADEHVDGAELGQAALDHRLAHRGVADVAERGDGADAGLVALRGDRVELPGVDPRVQHEVRAFGRERKGDGAADVAAGAGDERDSSLEPSAVHRQPAAFSAGNTASRKARISCSGPTNVCSGMM